MILFFLLDIFIFFFTTLMPCTFLVGLVYLKKDFLILLISIAIFFDMILSLTNGFFFAIAILFSLLKKWLKKRKCNPFLELNFYHGLFFILLLWITQTPITNITIHQILPSIFLNNIFLLLLIKTHPLT